jgi:hypothetical protein
MAGKIKDPVEDAVKEADAQAQEKEVRQLFEFRPEDLKPMSQRVARRPMPFDGFPLAPPMEVFAVKNDGTPISSILVSATYVIVYSMGDFVPQDETGEGTTIERLNMVTASDGTIKQQRTGELFTVNIANHHSRVFQDYDPGPTKGKNVEIVFDRRIESNGRMFWCAIIPSHSLRSQFFFKFDNKGRVDVVTDYMTVDARQQSRLRETFYRIHYQQLQSEKLANTIEGKTPDGKE